MHEHDMIQTYFSPLSRSTAGAFGLTDDAAVLDIPDGQSLVCTTDALTAGVHFFPDDAPYLLAQKLMGVNLSDLAAMGASPFAYLLALHLPRTTTAAWLADFSGGINQSLQTYGGSLIGGDTTTHDGALCMSLTALGLLPKGQALRRNGANIGDAVYVSGTIGDGHAGLHYARNTTSLASLPQKQKDWLLSRYHVPTPRLELGMALRRIASSCMDISDGLIGDLNHICRQSQVGATLLLENIPLSDAAMASQIPLLDLISGGDDYELLFTVSQEQEALLGTIKNTPLTRIGHITRTTDPMVTLLDSSGHKVAFEHSGYVHRLGVER